MLVIFIFFILLMLDHKTDLKNTENNFYFQTKNK